MYNILEIVFYFTYFLLIWGVMDMSYDLNTLKEEIEEMKKQKDC